MCGGVDAMRLDLESFAQLGVEHLVVVLETTDPDEIDRRAVLFQTEVVAPVLS
jgi:hypothetical protein